MSKNNKKTSKPRKSVSRKPDAKKADTKSKALANHGPEVYICTVDGWVRYRGKRYVKDETIMVHPDKMSPTDLETLHKYFDPKPMEIMNDVSEPVELLDEGNDHVSNSN
jgi:hypothetical protein